MKLHFLQGYIQTIILAEYPNKLLLLDGCCRTDVSLIERFITKTLQRPFTDLTLVVVTHMHSDHAGAANKLRKLTQCKIASANVATQWYSGINGKLMHLIDIFLAKWVARKMKKPQRRLWYSSYLYPDYKLNDKDNLPGFSEWTVLTTPGHTDRDLSLQHIPSNRIYIADLIVCTRKGFIPPFPIFYPKQYKSSLKKIANLKPNSIILAHGGEFEFSSKGFQQVLEKAPNEPKTHWRSVKSKLNSLFSH